MLSYQKNIFTDVQLSKLRENFESILKPDRNKKTPIGENFKVKYFLTLF